MVWASRCYKIVSEKLPLGNGNVPRQWLKAEERPHMPKGSDEDPMVKTIPWRLCSALMVIAAAGRCIRLGNGQQVALD